MEYKCNHKYISIDHRKVCVLCDYVKTKGRKNGTIDVTPLPDFFFKQTARRRHQTTCRATPHFADRMKQREIDFTQIKETILTGDLSHLPGECVRYKKDGLVVTVNPVFNHLVTCYKQD